jgi:hypothetical protein
MYTYMCIYMYVFLKRESFYRERMIIHLRILNSLIDKIILTDLLLEQLQGYVNHITINNLLNISKKYKNAKKLQFYWKLNNKYSVKYYRENDFKYKINSLFTNMTRQLSLNFGGYDAIWDVTSLRNIHSLDLSFCYRVSVLKYIHLHIDMCTYICIHMHINVLKVRMYLHSYVLVFICIYICIYIHISLFVYIYIGNGCKYVGQCV